MAQDVFTGSNGTALATHDSSWTANTVGDGLTGMSLDGSGHLQQTGFNFSDVFYNGGGTGADSPSHITIPAGTTIDSVGNLMGAGCRMNTTERGYQAFLKSSTNVNTNFDQVGVRKSGSFFATINLSSAIDLSTTPVELTIALVSTNVVRVTVNAQSPYDNADGGTVVTGGYPGLFIYHNSGSPTQTIDGWTDDAVSFVKRNNFMLFGMGR